MLRPAPQTTTSAGEFASASTSCCGGDTQALIAALDGAVMSAFIHARKAST